MAHHKLLLDDDLGEDFSLIAIHCSEEDYKLAYILNRKLDLRLKRAKDDVLFKMPEYTARFPLFEFEDEFRYTQYHLIANTYKANIERENPESNLFSDAISENIVIHKLLPEFEKTDYFIKISSDFEMIPLRKTISLINEIQQIISAYIIDNQKIKSTHNLIFN